MPEVKKKIAVIFPGRNYSVDCPLLYYANFSFAMKGYERVLINYRDILKKNEISFDERIENVKKDVYEHLSACELSKYTEIVFVSKSLGTVIAGWAEERLGISVRHIFLTPLRETFPYIKKDKCIVIGGTDDSYLESGVLNEHCKKESVQLELISGVGHSLEYQGNVEKSLEVLRMVIEFYK